MRVSFLLENIDFMLSPQKMSAKIWSEISLWPRIWRTVVGMTYVSSESQGPRCWLHSFGNLVSVRPLFFTPQLGQPSAAETTRTGLLAHSRLHARWPRWPRCYCATSSQAPWRIWTEVSCGGTSSHHPNFNGIFHELKTIYFEVNIIELSYWKRFLPSSWKFLWLILLLTRGRWHRGWHIWLPPRYTWYG